VERSLNERSRLESGMLVALRTQPRIPLAFYPGYDFFFNILLERVEKGHECPLSVIPAEAGIQ
jgi:hypothetical protein